jgi:hypothetical protein
MTFFAVLRAAKEKAMNRLITWHGCRPPEAQRREWQEVGGPEVRTPRVRAAEQVAARP